MIIQKIGSILRLSGDLIPFATKQIDLTLVNENTAIRIGKTKSGTLLCHVVSAEPVPEQFTVKSKIHGTVTFHQSHTAKAVTNVEIGKGIFYSIMNNYEGDEYSLPDSDSVEIVNNPFS